MLAWISDFCVLGIGCSYVDTSYTVFQRACFGYLAEHMPRIRGLVDAIGDAALEEYCFNGFLDRGAIDRIGRAGGLDGAGESEEDVDEEEDEMVDE